MNGRPYHPQSNGSVDSFNKIDRMYLLVQRIIKGRVWFRWDSQIFFCNMITQKMLSKTKHTPLDLISAANNGN